MSYRLYLSQSFKRSVRQLERRFRNVKEDVKLALGVLEQSPDLGVVVPGASGIRKLRIRNSDLSRGKSGGYRLLYAVDDKRSVIYLLLLYFKSDQADVTRSELLALLSDLSHELDDV